MKSRLLSLGQQRFYELVGVVATTPPRPNGERGGGEGYGTVPSSEPRSAVGRARFDAASLNRRRCSLTPRTGAFEESSYEAPGARFGTPLPCPSPQWGEGNAQAKPKQHRLSRGEGERSLLADSKHPYLSRGESKGDLQL